MARLLSMCLVNGAPGDSNPHPGCSQAAQHLELGALGWSDGLEPTCTRLTTWALDHFGIDQQKLECRGPELNQCLLGFNQALYRLSYRGMTTCSRGRDSNLRSAGLTGGCLSTWPPWKKNVRRPDRRSGRPHESLLGCQRTLATLIREGGLEPPFSDPESAVLAAGRLPRNFDCELLTLSAHCTVACDDSRVDPVGIEPTAARVRTGCSAAELRIQRTQKNRRRLGLGGLRVRREMKPP